MALYTYTGPVQSVSLTVGIKKDKEGVDRSEFKDFALVPNGKPLELPEENPVIVSMLDSKLLILADEKEAVGKVPPAPKGEK